MLYSPLRALAYRPTAGLSSTCPLTEVKDHPASLGLTHGSMLNFPATVGFLDQNYCYKSVTTQISHNAGLALVCMLGIKPRTTTCKSMILPLGYGSKQDLDTYMYTTWK